MNSNSIRNLLLILSLIWSPLSFSKNLHLVDSNRHGFAIYRTGKPSAEDIKEFCRLRISEIVVLSGDAESVELKHKDLCPSLSVVYNEKQEVRTPLTRSFLENFDHWVKISQTEGKKIAFRCDCGCHRTGRLAAYYQMKYQSLSVQDAVKFLYKFGKNIDRYPELIPQITALEDFANQRPCSTEPQYCVGEK